MKPRKQQWKKCDRIASKLIKDLRLKRRARIAKLFHSSEWKSFLIVKAKKLLAGTKF